MCVDEQNHDTVLVQLFVQMWRWHKQSIFSFVISDLSNRKVLKLLWLILATGKEVNDKHLVFPFDYPISTEQNFCSLLTYRLQLKKQNKKPLNYSLFRFVLYHYLGSV